jgi:hypothetical protein
MIFSLGLLGLFECVSGGTVHHLLHEVVAKGVGVNPGGEVDAGFGPDAPTDAPHTLVGLPQQVGLQLLLGGGLKLLPDIGQQRCRRAVRALPRIALERSGDDLFADRAPARLRAGDERS